MTPEIIEAAAKAIYYEMGGEEDFNKSYDRDLYCIAAISALEAALGDKYVIVPKVARVTAPDQEEKQ